MTKNLDIEMTNYGSTIFWLLRMLAQLPPFEIKLDIPDSTDQLVITLDLELKS